MSEHRAVRLRVAALGDVDRRTKNYESVKQFDISRRNLEKRSQFDSAMPEEKTELIPNQFVKGQILRPPNSPFWGTLRILDHYDRGNFLRFDHR